MIDLIGDVHGYADELEELLQKLGYTKKDTYYSHPDANRKALFVGDYIDRGPKVRETLEIVKNMADNGSAIALLGNHEYNALCFHTQDAEGNYLRKHSKKNIDQHAKTIAAFENREEEFEMYLEWFKTLPLFYETDKFRAVHACWDYKSIEYLKNHLDNNRLTDELLHASVIKNTPLYDAIENTLKGKEIPMPGELTFLDTGGDVRSDLRIKWWEDLSDINYKDISVQTIDELKNSTEKVSGLKDMDYYKPEDKPVFFGHYWLKEDTPSLFRDNICCLDYSVADDGHLVAYSFDGESKLNNNNLKVVKTKSK